jgi:signal transduction histidine kinase
VVAAPAIQGWDRISGRKPSETGGKALLSRWLASARARILIAYVGVLVVVALLSLVGLRQVLISSAAHRADRGLQHQADRFVEFLGHEPHGARNPADLKAMFAAYLDRIRPDRDDTYVLFIGGRHQPTLGARTREYAHAKLLRPLAGTTRRRHGELKTREGPIRYMIAPIRMADGRRGALAVTLDFGSEIADEVNTPVRLLTIVLFVVLLGGSIMAFLVAGRALAPVSVLADTVRSINESDLTRRIPVDGHDEVSELARTFNAMLDRVEAAFESQRKFISDGEHELRTPITIIRGHLEVISDDPVERRQTLDLVLDELDRMTRLVDDLLVLARADQPDFLQLEEIDVDAFAEELHAKATGLAPREWRLVAATPGRLKADRHRLTQAVMNLAENAVRHTHEDEVIELGSSVHNGTVRIWVRDGGPGVEPGQEQRIFERFARGHSAGRTNGAGLGLAIVRAIAEAHGGGVSVRSRPGLGATFEIAVPVEPRPEGTHR